VGTSYLDRRQALEGADFIINSIPVGGYPATVVDFEVPARFGLRQTIGDTVGIGGIFRALRTLPVLSAPWLSSADLGMMRKAEARRGFRSLRTGNTSLARDARAGSVRASYSPPSRLPRPVRILPRSAERLG
jgi:hypothetical protein